MKNLKQRKKDHRKRLEEKYVEIQKHIDALEPSEGITIDISNYQVIENENEEHDECLTCDFSKYVEYLEEADYQVYCDLENKTITVTALEF